jgi:hypothetical protein
MPHSACDASTSPTGYSSGEIAECSAKCEEVNPNVTEIVYEDAEI